MRTPLPLPDERAFHKEARSPSLGLRLVRPRLATPRLNTRPPGGGAVYHFSGNQLAVKDASAPRPGMMLSTLRKAKDAVLSHFQPKAPPPFRTMPASRPPAPSGAPSPAPRPGIVQRAKDAVLSRFQPKAPPPFRTMPAARPTVPAPQAPPAPSGAGADGHGNLLAGGALIGGAALTASAVHNRLQAPDAQSRPGEGSWSPLAERAGGYYNGG